MGGDLILLSVDPCGTNPTQPRLHDMPRGQAIRRFPLLCESADDLGGDMEEEDGGNEGEGKDEDDEGVTRKYRKTDEHHSAI